jgi:hypothetical protein
VLRELHLARQAIKNERVAAAKLFRGAFGAPPEPKPDGGASPLVAKGADSAVQAGGAASGRGLAAWLLGALWAVLAALLGFVKRAIGRT